MLGWSSRRELQATRRGPCVAGRAGSRRLRACADVPLRQRHGRRAVHRTCRCRVAPLESFPCVVQPGWSTFRESGEGDEMNVNIAARAGRWSAAHWKTAVSAWLVFCIVAIALGAVAGTRDAEAGGHRRGRDEDGRADPAGRRLPGSRRRERARPVEDRDHRRPGVPRHRRGRCTLGVRAPAGAARAVAARSRERRPGLAGPALGARPVRDPGRRGQGRQEGAARPRRRRARPAAASRLHGRRVRLRQLDARAEQHAEQGLPAGRVLLAPGDADHPALRVRSARRRRAARAPRLLRRARDDRSLRAREPRRRRRQRDASR